MFIEQAYEDFLEEYDLASKGTQKKVLQQFNRCSPGFGDKIVVSKESAEEAWGQVDSDKLW